MSGGSYYIPIERLALGGMAEVVLAVQRGLGGLERLVVLKRVLPHLREDPAFSRMFLDEARLASHLRHPNIVDVLDVQRDGESFFIVMEYLSGEDLRHVLDKMFAGELAMPLPVAARIIADSAAGLHHAHTARDRRGVPLNLVHRDVAPGNLMVTFDGVSKLLDFGVAKAAILNSHTEPGQIKGKFAYCSPEHVLQGDIDYRADIFSLGVIFYELITGQRLFGGGPPPAVLSAVLNKPIASPRDLNPEVPGALEQLAMKALERDPDNRLASASEFSEWLEEWLDELDIKPTELQVAEWMRDSLEEDWDRKQNLERAALQHERLDPATADLPNFMASELEISQGNDSYNFPSVSGTTGSPHTNHTASDEPEGITAVLYAALGVGLTLLVLAALAAAFIAGRSLG